MKIGELAKTGITPSRIRFYEAEGLLPRPSRQGNGIAPILSKRQIC
jgi:DNA-binding transcriptional MerR regulator